MGTAHVEGGVFGFIGFIGFPHLNCKLPETVSRVDCVAAAT